MASRMKELLAAHIRNNISKYLLLLVAFATGAAAGAFAINGLSFVQRHELSAYLEGFHELLDGYTVENSELLRLSAGNNIKLVILLWVLGVSIIGIPLIFVTIGIRGFITGFSSYFLIKSMGGKGILFCIAAIMSKEIIMVPALIALGVNGINFSLDIISNRQSKNLKKYNLKTSFAAYCAAAIFYSSILFTGILVEAYISPVLIRLIAPVIK